MLSDSLLAADPLTAGPLTASPFFAGPLSVDSLRIVSQNHFLRTALVFVREMMHFGILTVLSPLLQFFYFQYEKTQLILLKI